MRTPEGIVLIDADKDREVAFEVGEDKIVMSDFAKKFNKYQAHVVTQDGYVAATDGKCNLEVGDHVYGHHFMCEPEKEIVVDDKKYYSNTYESLYCRVKDGEIEMLGQWNFIKPIYEPIENVRTKSGIYISNVHSAINCMGS